MHKIKDFEEGKPIDFHWSLETGRNVVSSSNTEMSFQMWDSNEISAGNYEAICSASIFYF